MFTCMIKWKGMIVDCAHKAVLNPAKSKAWRMSGLIKIPFLREGYVQE